MDQLTVFADNGYNPAICVFGLACMPSGRGLVADVRESMKKHLLLAIRILVAVLGIGYIAWAVDWADHVKLPQGQPLPNGQSFDTERTFPIVSGRYNPRSPDPSATLVIQINDQPGSAGQLPISASVLSKEESGLQFVSGVLTMIRHANVKLLAMGLLVVAPIYPILMFRWWMLMRCRGMEVPLWKAFRLTMVGNFFNFCMPGTTGGDLVKAYYAAKGSDRRADAVMTVIVDRVTGLLGLVVLAGIAGLFILEDDLARSVTLNIWVGMGCFSIGAGIYFSRRVRKALRVDWIISKLPMQRVLSSIDRAAVAYRDHRVTVLMSITISILVHVCLASSTAISGYALGMDRPFGLMLTVVPVLFLTGAVPISPQGVGVMEFVAIELLSQPGLATPNQIVGMLILIRINQIIYSLFGSIFLLKGDIHLHPQITELDESDGSPYPPSSTPAPAADLAC